jgi:hypothetical protein
LQPRTDEVYAAFIEAGDEGVVIAHGACKARVLLKVTPKRLYVLCDGEPPGKCLSGAFGEAVRGGKIKHSMSALVDLSHYTGQVDWDHVKAVRDMAAWGKDGDSNVAYVVRDNIFHSVIKIAAALFTDTRHEPFLDRAAAEAWLDSVEERR